MYNRRYNNTIGGMIGIKGSIMEGMKGIIGGILGGKTRRYNRK